MTTIHKRTKMRKGYPVDLSENTWIYFESDRIEVFVRGEGFHRITWDALTKMRRLAKPRRRKEGK